MFVGCFIDWENIEKTASKNLGAVLNYTEFVASIRMVAEREGGKLASISAYGDFDKGIAGIMTKLTLLGVEPKHIVTKNSHEYMKGSVDIEISLDILETMYAYPHISDYLIVSGDSDLRYVIRRLTKQGKKVTMMGFENNTSQFLINNVHHFERIEDYPASYRKVSKTDLEARLDVLKINKLTGPVLNILDRLESDKPFVAFNFFRTRCMDRFPNDATTVSEVITEAKELGLLLVSQIANPNAPSNPTTIVKLDRTNDFVSKVLAAFHD